MPKVKAPEPEQSPDYLLTQKLINEFRQFWVDKMKEEGGSQVRFSRLSVLALTQVASIVAVDVGMNHDQFTAVCLANFKEAYKRAPKFGA